MKVLLKQPIATTGLDNHGERAPKERLEYLAEKLAPRQPLNQEHDLRLPSVGYLENFAVVPDLDRPGEWILLADIHFSTESADEALKGFSYSLVEEAWGNLDSHEYGIYLPFPAYNDFELIDLAVQHDSKLVVGKWIKKGLSVGEVALLVNMITFALGPAWTNLYNREVAPRIEVLLKLAIRLRRNNLSSQFSQSLFGNHGESFGAMFFPEEGNGEQELTTRNIYHGIKDVMRHLELDKEVYGKPIYQARLSWDSTVKQYKVFQIQYTDGNVRYVA